MNKKQLTTGEAVKELMQGRIIEARPFFKPGIEKLFPGDFVRMSKTNIWEYLREYSEFWATENINVSPETKPISLREIISLQ